MITLKAATLIDGTGTQPRHPATVTIEGDRIRSVESQSDEATNGNVIDLEGCTLLPGLIDAHSHLGILEMFPSADTPAAVVAARIFENCQLALDAGFTTVRDLGGLDGGVAEAVRLGLVRGPRILPSGPVLCQSGGHGDDGSPWLAHQHAFGTPGLTQASLVCDGPDSVRAAARTAFRRGATQLKVCVTGGVVSRTDRLEDTQFTVEELRAAVEEAQARDTYVTAHAHTSRGIANGLSAGIECFEHGSFLDEETAEAMARSKAALVPTLAVMQVNDPPIPSELLSKMEGLWEAMTLSVKRARAAGILIGSGSDLVGPRQNRRGLELALKSEILGPMEAIVSATAANAKIVRRESDIGTIEPGKIADFIAVDGNPLEEPGLFDDPRRVRLVIKDGVITKDMIRA